MWGNVAEKDRMLLIAAELETELRAVWDDPLYADMFPGGFDAKLSGD